MRAKDYLAELGTAHPISGTGQEYSHMGPLSLPRGVMTRDHWDATRADVLLVNLKGAKAVSIGTVMEIAWAFTHKIPVIAVMEEGNIHEHMMISEAIGFRVDTLEEGLHMVHALLGKDPILKAANARQRVADFLNRDEA